jgi:hypothetical protein
MLMKKNYKSLSLFWLLFLLGTTVKGQQTYTFTHCGAVGSAGPTQLQVNNTYSNTNLNSLVTVTLGGIQTWTAPYTGNFRIEARGAQGGLSGGLGATMSGDFALTVGEVIRILVGQQGTVGGAATSPPGGGGGGSFVVRAPYNTGGSILVIAGGGSGAGSYPSSPGLTTSSGGAGGGAGGVNGNGGAGGTRGAGGGGFFTNGDPCTASSAYANPGMAFVNGGAGGMGNNNCSFLSDGGFGGGSSHGGQCIPNGGAGGGYSGGGGSSNNASGGGGSLNTGINQTNTQGNNSGDGRVIITELCSVRITASGSNSVNPVLCSGNSLTLTTDAVSGYNWSNGNTTSSVIVVSPTTTTVYSVQATSSLACVAVGIITVTVSNGLPVLAVSNPSNNICLGQTATLTASGALTYTWTGGVVNGQTFTPSSTDTYTVSGENGCGITTAVTTITVAPLQVTAAASSTLVCEGYTSTLTAASVVNAYTWQPGGFTGSTVAVAPLANTIYTVLANDGICSGTATVEVTTKTTPTITTAAPVASVCEGGSVTLSASGAGQGGTYTWTPGNLSGSSITVAPTSSTLYVVMGTNSLNCESSANQVVLVTAAPLMQVNASSNVVCSGSSVNISASGANTYTWVGGPASANYTVSPAATTIYTVLGEQNNNICIATRTIQITAVVPNVTVSNNMAICSGQTATLTASGANTYAWNGGPALQLNTAQYTPSTTTIYTVVANTISPPLTCPSTHTILVTVNSNPTITVVATRARICRNETNTLTASGAVTYDWGTLPGSASVVTISPQISTIYTITGTDNNGCEGSILLQTIVSLCTGISENGMMTQNISVFPNPTNGAFTVKVESDITLKLMSNLGQHIKTIILNSDNQFTTEINKLSSGIYFLVGENENGKVNQKIVITE